MTRQRGERILGPYAQHNGWRVVEVDAAGSRSATIFPSEVKALRYVELMTAELDRADHTTETALTKYKAHLSDKGTQEQSIASTARSIAMFFPKPVSLATLTPRRCAALYESVRTTPTKLTGKPPAVDTHRNALVQTRSFLEWCVKSGWMRENTLADVEGIGRRRKRGKSLGKSGRVLLVREARAWYAAAIELAEQRDEGAIASLVALLLGMRASEIVSARVGDLDEDQEPGDLLWIPCSKTEAGRRQLEVPEPLRGMLVACRAEKPASGYLFAREDGGPHCRDWIRDNVQRVCRAAGVPPVTAHAMRGLLATITAERGLAGHLIAATLGHESEAITMSAYAAPGSAQTGVNRRGLTVLTGGAK